MELDFRAFASGGCRTYMLRDRLSAETALIDPAIDGVPEILGMLEREGLRLTHVVDTHTHADHISGAAALADATGCAYVMHAQAPARCVTERVADGTQLTLAGVRAK